MAQEDGDEEDHPPDNADEVPKGIGTVAEGETMGGISMHRTTEIILSSAEDDVDDVDDELPPMHASIKPVSRVKPTAGDPLRPAVVVTDSRSCYIRYHCRCFT